MRGLFAAAVVSASLINPAFRVEPASQEWKDLAAAFAREPEGAAKFEERRQLGFTTKPVILKGESFVSATRGLSLHYTEPEERTVIIDSKGMLTRDKSGETAAPAVAQLNAANSALLGILRFDLDALAADFDLYGQTGVDGWRLELVPKSRTMQQVYAMVSVSGKGTAVSRILLKRSERSSIEILLTPMALPPAAEMQKHFR